VQIRRVQETDKADRYELHAAVPTDERLRGLEHATVRDLRELAGQLEINPEGDGRRRSSWLDPLQAAADAAPKTEEWVPAPRDVIAALPRYLRFSSTREPDLRSEIQQALRGAYERLLDNEGIVGQVRDAERQLQTQLEQEATGLRDHILDRCPELHGLRIEPSVSFREGFGQVTLHSGTRPGINVPVEYSGTGRRRRMTLAVWEWTRNLLEEVDGRPVIIAYDEPDTHLDYSHQRELVDLIRTQASRNGVRILVATHSLNLIDKVEIGDVVHLKLTDGVTRISRLLTDEHDEVDRYLATVSTAIGLRNSVLLHERLFVGVEGPSEIQCLPI
jgi:putative ATP-dependent endonuclease of the OLD family